MKPEFSREFMRADLLASPILTKADCSKLEKMTWRSSEVGYRPNLIIATNNALFPLSVNARIKFEADKKIRSVVNAMTWCDCLGRSYFVDHSGGCDVMCSSEGCDEVVGNELNFEELNFHNLEHLKLPTWMQQTYYYVGIWTLCFTTTSSRAHRQLSPF